MVTGPPGASFAEVTTKKGKNLRDLEAEATPAPVYAESDRTPPPVRPLPPLGAKLGAPAPAISRPAALPFAASVPPFVAPVASSTAPAVPPMVPVARFAAPAAPLVESAAVSAAPAALLVPMLSAADLPTPLPIHVPPFGGGVSSFVPADPRLTSGGLAGLFQRQPGLKYVVAAVAIVGLVILLGMVILRSEGNKRSEPTSSAAVDPPKAEEPKPDPAVVPAPPPIVEERTRESPRPTGKQGSGKTVHQVGPAPERPARGKQPAKPPRVVGARPNPFDEVKTVSQAQITSVVRNTANQAALKSCYERALKMDNHLTSGRMDVTVSIGTSGAVQRVVVNAPSSFILVEPCIKSAVKRWVFPPNTEEYGTNFPLIMQGGM